MSEITKDDLLFTTLSNREINLFDDLDVLGMYTYMRMIIHHETTTVCEIVDRIIGKFKVDHEFVMFVLGQLDKEGIMKVVKTK